MKLRHASAILFFSLILLATFVIVVHQSAFTAKENWLNVSSKNFTLVSNTNEKQTVRVATMLEQFRHTIATLLPNTNISTVLPTKVILFDNHASFRPFKPKYKGKIRDDVGGYFFKSGDQSYIALTTDAGGEQFYEVIFHEYQHFVIGNNLRKAPLWLNEGLAEYYSTFKPRDGGRQVLIGSPIGRHIGILRNKVFIPLSKLVAVDDKSPEYNEGSRAGVFYAESWAFVHYLMLADGGKHRPQLSMFLNLLNNGKPVEDNFKQAFQKDFEAMESDLLNYISKFTFTVELYTFPDQLNFSKEMQITVLSESQSETQLAELLLSTGRLDEAEPRLVKAVEKDSSCGQCQVTLGALRYKQYRFDEARSHLNKGLEIDPQNYLAHQFYGALLNEEGRYKEAIQSYQQVLRINPNLEGVYLDLSMSYIGDGQNNEADGTFERFIKLKNSEPLYYRLHGYGLLRMGFGKRAAEDSLTHLKMVGWQDSGAPYSALAAYFGYRKDKMAVEADKVLNEMADKMTASEWPFPVVKYLKRSITLQQLLSSAKDVGKQTEAHCYAGMDLILEGKLEEGVEHLRWVKEKGVTSYYEYGMALSELNWLERKKRGKAN
jgi:tetratricopeptide (TPR) repeat protein